MTTIEHLDRLRIALNVVPGIAGIDVVFRNSDVDTGTVPETVSPVGGLLTLRDAAAVLEVISSSVEDDPDKGGSVAGTGAWSIRVWGLDANYNIISEDITLNGTAAVTGTKLFLRINSVVVLAAGTTKSNVGNITLRDASAGATRSYIAAARGAAEVGLFTVPAGHKMAAQGWMIASRDSTGSSSADVEFWQTKNGVRQISWAAVVSGTLQVDFTLPHVFEEKTDIEVLVSRVLNADTVVLFHGHGILIGPNADI